VVPVEGEKCQLGIFREGRVHVRNWSGDFGGERPEKTRIGPKNDTVRREVGSWWIKPTTRTKKGLKVLFSKKWGAVDEPKVKRWASTL